MPKIVKIDNGQGLTWPDCVRGWSRHRAGDELQTRPSIRRSANSDPAASACRHTASRPGGSSSGSPPNWPPGQVKRAHYFGEELVIFRTASGQINVLDAYCQHLGREYGGRRHRRGRTHRLPVARLALERRRHQRADPVQQDRLQAERPHQAPTTARSGTASSWCGTNAMAAHRTGSRRCCPNWRPTSTTRCIRTPGW